MQEISFRKDVLPLKDQLFRLALRITFDRAEAEDIVQETLIRVWNKRDEWPQFGSIEAYCTTVARNLAIDRSEKKDAQTVELTSDMEQDTPDASSPYDRLVNKERLTLVHRLMNELPDKQRQIMQLRDIEGKSYKEIAVLLSLTEEQVKVNLFRARQKVKQRFLNIEGYGL
ncbi:MAG: RNA polymerase sigma factor [Bacteroides sp.]|nr:RNA polymerase sigma factor [Bacteroides sp.]